MKLFGFSLLAKFLMIIAVYATYVYLPMVSEVPNGKYFSFKNNFLTKTF